MQEGNPVGKEQIIIIEEQIKEALREVELLIEKKSIVKDASGLEAMEREIIKVTDRLAGLIVAQKIQLSVDSAQAQRGSLPVGELTAKEDEEPGAT